VADTIEKEFMTTIYTHINVGRELSCLALLDTIVPILKRGMYLEDCQHQQMIMCTILKPTTVAAMQTIAKGISSLKHCGSVSMLDVKRPACCSAKEPRDPMKK